MISENAKKWAKRAVAATVVAAAALSFLGAPTGAVLRIQPAISWPFLAVLVLTPLLGRLFCECLCPLGALQSFVNWLLHPKSHVRRVCTRLPASRAQLAVRWTVLCAFVALVSLGFGAVAWSVTPYSIFGKAMVLFAPGVAIFALVLVMAAVGKGRLWCNWICPAGTLFASLSLKSVCRHKVGGGCANCKACFGAVRAGDAASAPSDGDRQGGESDLTRRDTIKGVAILAAAGAVEKTTDGGFADVSLPLVPKRPATLLPPGAVDRRRFNTLCVGCGKCVKACPSGIIRQSLELATFGQPELFFQTDFCRSACRFKCAKACPVGALVAGDPNNKRNFHIGIAKVEKELCLRESEGVSCSACARKCPKEAISFVDDLPSVDPNACIGCGACEHVCAARPIPAIRVEPAEQQWESKPKDDAALIEEMKAMLDAGAACAIARGGFVVAQESGRGVSPLLKALDDGRLQGAIVVDKVIGRATAAMCVLGGARKVHAALMSEDALSFLKQHCIEASADKLVPQILNRDKSGRCPMELAVDGRSDPADMVKRVRAKLEELRRGK